MNALMFAEAQRACRRPGVDPDLFFIGERGGASQINAALAICAECPVQRECLDEVMSWPPRHRNVGMVAAGQHWPVRAKETS